MQNSFSWRNLKNSLTFDTDYAQQAYDLPYDKSISIQFNNRFSQSYKDNKSLMSIQSLFKNSYNSGPSLISVKNIKKEDYLLILPEQKQQTKIFQKDVKEQVKLIENNHEIDLNKLQLKQQRINSEILMYKTKTISLNHLSTKKLKSLSYKVHCQESIQEVVKEIQMKDKNFKYLTGQIKDPLQQAQPRYQNISNEDKDQNQSHNKISFSSIKSKRFSINNQNKEFLQLNFDIPLFQVEKQDQNQFQRMMTIQMQQNEKEVLIQQKYHESIAQQRNEFLKKISNSRKFRSLKLKKNHKNSIQVNENQSINTKNSFEDQQIELSRDYQYQNDNQIKNQDDQQLNENIQ